MTKRGLRVLAFIALILISFSGVTSAKIKIVTIGQDAVSLGNKNRLFESVFKTQNDQVAVAEVIESNINHLSHFMHEEFHRCGGFIVHDDMKEALDFANDFSTNHYAKNETFADYSIENQDYVKLVISQVEESFINSTIRRLSSYVNRYYNAAYGVQSSEWIGERWSDIVKDRTDAKVELYDHQRWMQPTPILTIEGSDDTDEVIVIGGHADSISGYFGGGASKAPGADDNASGIATITEIIRILVRNSYQPQKTIKFMAYAAEEVGLLGSKEIARKFRQEGVNVVGVMQLDMTNFKGSSDKDIVLISDNTNQEQNAFLGRLIDEYLKVPWTYDRCGYGCSDHAAWTGSGYPASFPFEAKKNDMNRAIHTSRDTIEMSRGSASHAVNFAKLGLAYLIELDR